MRQGLASFGFIMSSEVAAHCVEPCLFGILFCFCSRLLEGNSSVTGIINGRGNVLQICCHLPDVRMEVVDVVVSGCSLLDSSKVCLPPSYSRDLCLL